MKNFTNTIRILTALIIFASTFVSCGNSNTVSSPSNNEKSEDIVYQNEDIAEQYLNLKDALYQSNGTSAQKAAEQLKMSFESRSDDWPKSMINLSKSISDTARLSVQRMNFKLLSDEMIIQLKNKNSLGIRLYIQYCPMAFANEGASWLSDESKIENPYYDSDMEDCGFVKETIPTPL